MSTISVVIPVYNSLKILECLQALEKQTYKDFEVVVVDDGSKPAMAKEIRKCLKKIRLKTRFCRISHSGPAGARNYGVKQAKGNVVLFTDADCVPDKKWVSEMFRPFRNRSVSGVSGTYRTHNKESTIARFVGYEIALRHARLGKLKEIDFIGTFSAAYRRDIFLRAGGFDASFKTASGEDPEFSFRLVKHGHKLVFNPDAFVYHAHPDTLYRYLRQKFNRGYWRVALYKKHPTKVKGETYTPFWVNIQIPLSLLFIISLPLSLYLSLAFLLLVIVPNIYEGAKMFKYEKKMLILAPIILTLRSFSSLFGVIAGVLGAFCKRIRKP